MVEPTPKRGAHRATRVTAASVNAGLQDETAKREEEDKRIELTTLEAIALVRKELGDKQQLSDDTVRKADLAFKKNQSQSRAITRAYERIERDSIRIKRLEDMLDVAETRAGSDDPSLKAKADADVHEIAVKANPLLKAYDEDLAVLRQHMDEEIERLDGRITSLDEANEAEFTRVDGDIKRVDGRVGEVAGDLDLTKRDVADQKVIITRISGFSVKIPIWPLIIGLIAGAIAWFATIAALGFVPGFWTAFQNAWGWTFGVAGFIYVIYFIVKLASNRGETETVEERHETTEYHRPNRVRDGVGNGLAFLGLGESNKARYERQQRESARYEPVIQTAPGHYEPAHTEPVRNITTSTTRS